MPMPSWKNTCIVTIKYINPFDAIAYCDDNYHKLNLPDIGLTEFAQAMPEEYKSEDAVKAYQTYYFNDKKHFAKWTKRNIPSFMFP